MRTTPVDPRSCEQPDLSDAIAAPVRGTVRRKVAWSAAAACLFAVLTWQVLARGVMTRWDAAARRQVQDWAFRPGLGWLRSAAEVLRNLGDPQIAGTCCLLLAAWAAWWCRRPGPLLRAVGAMGVLVVVVWPMKVAIGRPGPGLPDVRPDWYGYFPSGHTASAAICYGAAALAVTTAVPRLRRIALSSVVVLVLVEGWALVWYDDHWVSDVVGSGAFAVVALTVAFGVRQPRLRPGDCADAPREARGRP